jgi:anti-anti-sigma regulatory factor
MSQPCRNHHLFVKPVPDGLVVLPVGRLPREGEWLLDPLLLKRVTQARPGCLYVDCSQIEFVPDAWIGHAIRLFRPIRGWGGKLILCGVRGALAEVLSLIRLDQVLGVRAGEAPEGRPFVPEHSWLAWNDGTVIALTRAILAERSFEQMPVLADALEEAGCTEPDILDHCRSGGPHFPDCWVLGMLAVDA